MFRVIILSVVLTVVLADSDDAEIKKKCHRLGHPGTMRCCKSDLIKPKMDLADIKECLDMPHNPHSCDHELCIAKKRGYLSDDGTLDKAAFEKNFSEDFVSPSPSLITAIKENCIDGDIDAYGRPDDCDLMKIKHCMHMQAINDCKEWNDDGPCAGVKDLVKECAKLLP